MSREILFRGKRTDNDETDKCEPCKECRKDETEGGKMNEQKQIEEIARFLEESYGKCVNFSDCTNRKCSQCYAEALCNAGYRKADEVRKETAKEILQTLYDKCFELDEEITVCKNCVDTADILQLAKCYGVEVEE